MDNDACESLFFRLLFFAEDAPHIFPRASSFFIYIETDCFVYKEQNACDLVHYHPSIPIKIVYLRL